MTSLARQLERLAVPYTQSVLGQDTRRASLLFDPKEAANLDKEAVFALSISGLEELETIDPAFIEFEATLFNTASHNWERSLQTKEVNDQLDETISQFLVQLSPYFLLRAAHKTLEWLIYKYHIHQFNVDSLLLCILPYHETKIFVRVVQLLPISQPTNKWNWIHSTANAGVPLARQTLVNHCRGDPGFFAFICEIVPKFIKCHGTDSKQLRAVIALFACTMLGALQREEEINERLLSVVVPHLIRGFKSRCTEYRAACCMVLSQLANVARLKESLLVSLMPVVTKRMSSGLAMEVLSCLAVICQTQALKALPKKSFKHMCRTPGIVQLLTNMSHKYQINSLLQRWFDRLILAAVELRGGSTYSSSEGSDGFAQIRPDYTNQLQLALAEVAIDKDLAKYLARSLMEKLLECRQKLSPHDDEMVSRWQQLAKHVLTTVDHRHSAALEVALEETLARHHNDSAMLSTLQETMSLTTTPLKYQLLPDSATCLLLGLSHAQPSMRLLALQQLSRCLHDNEELPGDFVEPVLLERLTDDSVHVASAALNLEPKLQEIVNKEKLLSCLLGVVAKRHGQPKWKPVTTSALEIICSPSMVTVMPDLGMTLLPYLLVTSGSDGAEIEDAKTILQSSGVGKDELLKRISPAWLREVSNKGGQPLMELIIKLNCMLVRGLAGTISESNKLSLWVSSVLGEDVRSNRSTFLLICALGELLRSSAPRARSKSRSRVEQKDNCLDTCSCLLSVLTALCDIKRQKNRVAADVPSSSLEQLFVRCLPAMNPTDAVPVALQLWAVDKIVSAVKSFSFKTESDMWLSVDDDHTSVVLRLLNLLMRWACVDTTADNPWRQLLHRLVTGNIDQSVLHRLFPYMWTSDISRDDRLSSHISAVLQVGSFYLMANRWQQLPDSVSDTLQKDCAVIPSLLVCLHSQQVAVRHGALRCLRLVRSQCRSHASVFASVIKRLVTQEEEIVADPLHTPQVIGKIYSKLDKPGRQESLQQLLEWTTSSDTPADMKERLLELLSNVPHQHVLRAVLPLGLKLLDTFTNATSDLSSTQVNILRLILTRFDNSTACDLHEGHPSLDFLMKAMTTEKGVVGLESPQCMAIAQMTREFFWALPDLAGQHRIVTCLLDVETSTKCPTVSTAVRSALKQLKLNGQQIFHEIPGEDMSEVATIKGKKRARIGKVAPPINYRRLTLLLEVVQSRKRVKDSESLVARLFALLNRLLSQEAEEVEYCNQLILSCLLNICTRWKQKPSQEESFNVEILVRCIRSSSSPQTQRQALLLMASVAHLLPEYILHNVMSIFTFMGTNMLQQDDSYSFHVITMTMQTIIPALIKAHEGDDSGTLSDQIAGILRVFIDARHHVPKHRSQLLFRQLIDTIDPQRHLWMVMVLMMESAVRSKNVPTVAEDSIIDEVKKGMTRIDQDIEFTSRICEQFPAAVQMRACTHVMAFLQKLSHRNEQVSQRSRAETLELINADSLSIQQLRQLQMHMTRLIAVLLSCESFATQILMKYDKMTEKDTVDEFSAFVRECLCYLSAVTKNQSGAGCADTAAVKFWKSVLHKVYDILDKVNYLLPTSVFLEVVSTLMQHTLVGVRRKALELLNRKLQQLQPSALSDAEVQSLLMLVEKLITMATVGKLVTVATAVSVRDVESDVVTVQQLALFGLKLMCKILGAQHPKAFAKVFDVSIKILGESSTDAPPPPMIASALLCLAELCTTTKAHAIPYLSRFMPPLIATLNNRALLMGHELVLICALTALHRITSSLPHFLSPYLVDIILAVCQMSSLVSPADKLKKSQASIRLSGVRHQIATAVSPRVLVPALSDCYSRLLIDNHDGVLLLMEILRESIESMSKDDLAAQHNALVTLFCSVLDLCNAPQLRLSQTETDQVESAAIDAVLAMVVRLSENTFRPMFYKLYDWACREDSEEYKNRKLTFFRLAERLSERLKSLFNLFAGHIIKTATHMLDQNNSLHSDTPYFGDDEPGTQKSCLVLGYIIGCLHKCMLYDTDGFVNSDIFKLLLQPLVDQLENFVGGDAAYEARVHDHATPCISQLAVTTRDDSAWKTLNYQILLKTRHNLPKVRFAALKTIEDLAQKLGDEYMSLVPETIPFLAELMEDESEEVEQLCQQVIASMEDVLGESLQKYF